MNARGHATVERAMTLLRYRSDRRGEVRHLSLSQLAARLGMTQRHMQNVVAALEAAGRLIRTVRQGLINTYQLVGPWMHGIIASENGAADAPAAASSPAAPASPPRKPWWMGEHLDHHPTL